MSVPGRAIIRTNASTELLWQIAESGELSELDAILKKGADINGCNRNGVSALMRAAAAGRHEMVQSLLEHGADVDAHRDDGFTALLLATFFGHLETVQILVEHGAKLDQTTRCATSRTSTQKENVSVSEAVREAGHHNRPAPVARSPLSLAGASIVLDGWEYSSGPESGPVVVADRSAMTKIPWRCSVRTCGFTARSTGPPAIRISRTSWSA